MKSFIHTACALAIFTLLSLPAAAQDDEKPAQAPETYKVKVETSKGDFVIEVTREVGAVGSRPLS